MIIFINGASSSGKTSLARALQEKWSRPLLYCSLDAVIAQLPFALTGEGSEAVDGFPLNLIRTPEGSRPSIGVGSIGRDLIDLSAQYVASIAGCGYDVVVDYVLLDDRMYEAFRKKLAHVETVFVGVICNSETLNQRESARGDRALGLSEQQENSVHFCRSQYDLELESTTRSPAQLASVIIRYVIDSEITLGLGKTE